jgi:hypothetical protein
VLLAGFDEQGYVNLSPLRDCLGLAIIGSFMYRATYWHARVTEICSQIYLPVDSNVVDIVNQRILSR